MWVRLQLTMYKNKYTHWTHSSWLHLLVDCSQESHHRSCCVGYRFCLRDIPISLAPHTLHTETHTHTHICLTWHRTLPLFILLYKHKRSSLTACVFIAVIITVCVSITTFGWEDTSSRTTFKVTGRALWNKQTNTYKTSQQTNSQVNIMWWQSVINKCF